MNQSEKEKIKQNNDLRRKSEISKYKLTVIVTFDAKQLQRSYPIEIKL